MRRCKGFTLVEIMIVVTIIGLLVAMLFPGMIKARKKSFATSILSEVRLMNDAVDQWALEKRKREGAPIVTSEAAQYLKGTWHDKDLLGNPYIIGTVGYSAIKISQETKDSLAGVGIDWGPY